ncbi:hypothetical protein AURDEDRAFT_162562 [Auricularia subglabra TFB-10046 SS5]|nr:hypothetical protein AURDEDRAFT_162562 [Auricularia subglabra TFB-10046 SS5]
MTPDIPTEIITTIGASTVTLHLSSPGATSQPEATAPHRGHWEIALLVVGILAAICAACLAVFCWRRRGRRRADMLARETPVQVTAAAKTITLINPAPTPSVSTYAFTRPGSSVSTSRPTPWRNSRIGISPYTYEHPVPYPETATERSSYIDPMPIPTPARRSIVPAVPVVLEGVLVRHVSLSGKGRVLKVQNPETRSTTSVTETDTAH